MLAVDQDEIDLVPQRLRGLVDRLERRKPRGLAMQVIGKRQNLRRSVKGPVDLIVEHVVDEVPVAEPIGVIGPVYHFTDDFPRHGHPAASWFWLHLARKFYRVMRELRRNAGKHAESDCIFSV